MPTQSPRRRAAHRYGRVGEPILPRRGAVAEVGFVVVWYDNQGNSNYDLNVMLDDLVQCANVALGGLYTCWACDANQDGRVVIHEPVGAVATALAGCPGAIEPP